MFVIKNEIAIIMLSFYIDIFIKENITNVNNIYSYIKKLQSLESPVNMKKNILKTFYIIQISF